MGNSHITMREAMRIIRQTGDMNRAVPFSCKWVRANRKLQTGGQIAEARGITLMQNERALPKSMRTGAASRDRNRNRSSNATVDVWYDGREDCIHIFLILEVNGKTVI